MPTDDLRSICSPFSSAFIDCTARDVSCSIWGVHSAFYNIDEGWPAKWENEPDIELIDILSVGKGPKLVRNDIALNEQHRLNVSRDRQNLTTVPPLSVSAEFDTSSKAVANELSNSQLGCSRYGQDCDLFDFSDFFFVDEHRAEELTSCPEISTMTYS